jgi:glycosyltransferase involved in cell wall biosynthesis
MQKIKVLLVGPLNKEGVGGRLEEMKVWAKALDSAGAEVQVFTRFNSAPLFGILPVLESANVAFGEYFFNNPLFKKIILRMWGSKFFKSSRNHFFESNSWNRFLDKFDKVVLFITDSSAERKIFESNTSKEIIIRFTGTITDFSKLICDGNSSTGKLRSYIFHDKNLLAGFKPKIPYKFIDQTAFKEKELLEIPINGNCKSFAMVGLFMEVKNIETAIESFCSFPDFKLLIFGKGELETNLIELIRKLKLTNVEIRGFFPSEKMHLMYEEFDCLIVNSSEETGPMTGVEAMASGKCIISSAVGAMQGRIDNNFWITGAKNTLEQVLSSVRNIPSEQILQERNRLRNRYVVDFSNKAIASQIVQTILVD